MSRAWRRLKDRTRRRDNTKLDWTEIASSVRFMCLFVCSDIGPDRNKPLLMWTGFWKTHKNELGLNQLKRLHKTWLATASEKTRGHIRQLAKLCRWTCNWRISAAAVDFTKRRTLYAQILAVVHSVNGSSAAEKNRLSFLFNRRLSRHKRPHGRKSRDSG